MPPLRPRYYAADQDDDPFREAWEHAQKIEADLHRPADPPAEDPISAMTRALAVRAGSLERELAPGRDATRPSGPFPSRPRPVDN